jgi:hypothetical protein
MGPHSPFSSDFPRPHFQHHLHLNLGSLKTQGLLGDTVTPQCPLQGCRGDHGPACCPAPETVGQTFAQQGLIHNFGDRALGDHCLQEAWLDHQWKEMGVPREMLDRHVGWRDPHGPHSASGRGQESCRVSLGGAGMSRAGKAEAVLPCGPFCI